LSRPKRSRNEAVEPYEEEEEEEEVSNGKKRYTSVRIMQVMPPTNPWRD
jgi:hypothetical protein